jgi:hypothetical protein
MHNETIGVITAQRNIEASLREVHGMLDNLDVLQPRKDSSGTSSSVVTTETLSERLHNNYYEFTHTLFQLIESHKYWVGNSKFAGADRIVKRLNDLISSSAQVCAIEFDKLLATSSKTIDISRTGWPLPAKFEWVSDTVLDRLSLIAQGLVVAQNSGVDQKVLQGISPHQGFVFGSGGTGDGATIVSKPLHSLLVNRGPFLKATYKLLLQNHSALTQGSGIGGLFTKVKKQTKSSHFYTTAESSRIAHPSITHAPQDNHQVTITTVATTSGGDLIDEGDKLGRYVKGSHQVIFFTNVLLGLLESELKTWETILNQCDGLEQEEIDNAFSAVVIPVMGTFSKVIDDFLNTFSNNKLLFTLDVLGHLQSLQSRFRQTLKRGVDQQDSYSLFMTLKAQVTASIQSSLLEHIINSVKVSQFNKQTRRDGSIADVTVETVTFLRALCTYDDVLDTLPVEVAYTSTTKPFFSENRSDADKSNNIPSLEEVVALNARLSAETKAKYSSKNNGNTQGFLWRTVLPLSILPGLLGTHGLCTVSQGVVWDVLQGLDATLQVRSEALKLPALQWLFYLNNYHYIAQVATKHFFRVHPLFLTYYINKTQRSKILYQTHTFQNILSYLDTGNYDKKIEFFDTKKNKNVAQNAIPPAYAKLIKGKFANFNKHFKEAYQLQKNFAVPDSDLRGQLRSESVDIIIPMFENFVNKYGDLPFSTKHKHEYMCYTKELLETLLNKFFDELT